MTEQQTEFVIPEADIAAIAKSSLEGDIQTLRSQIDTVKTSGATAEEKLLKIERVVDEITKARSDRAADRLDSRHAGLYFDPTDANDPCVRFFGLNTRTDRVSGLGNAHLRGVFTTKSGEAAAPGLSARGLGLRLTLYCQARYLAHKNGITVENVLKRMGADWMVTQLKTWVERESTNTERDELSRPTIERSLGTVDATAAASLLPQEYSAEYIELLRNTAVFMSANPIEVPLGPGGLNYGRITSASTAAYKAEPAAINASQPGTGEITLHKRDLYAIVPMADSLYGAPRMAAIARDEAIRTLTERADLAALRGDGTSNTPRGLRSWATDGSTPDRIVASASADATPTTAELAQDIRTSGSVLAQSNVPGNNKAIFINPRTEWHVMYHVDDGYFPFREELMQGRFGMARYFSTNQIPNNLGGGTESELMQADMSEVIHGIHQDVTAEFFRGAAYNDSSGSVVAGTSTGETVLRVNFAHDIRVKHEEAVSVITGVLY